MPEYAWSCLACGSANGSGSTACAVCRCPAESTVEQQRSFRAGVMHGVPVVSASPPQPVSPAIYRALLRIRRNVWLFLVGGTIASLAIAALLHQYWSWSSSKAGVALVGFSAVGLMFAPCARYLAKLRCPRCANPWLAQSHSLARHGAFILWAFSSWQGCASCSLSVDAQRGENDA